MTHKARQVLKALRDASESADGQDWRMVYIDNAKASEECSDMSQKSFRSYLAALSQEGFYRVVDGYAWGSVKIVD